MDRRSWVMCLAAFLATTAARATLVLPSTVTVNVGVQAGTVSDLANCDTLYFTVAAPAPGIGQLHSLWTSEGTYVGTPVSANIELVERLNGFGIYTRNLDAFNWATGAYDVVDNRTLLPGVMIQTIPMPNQTTNYVNVNGLLRLRVRVFQSGPSLAATHQVDRLNWDVTP